MADGRRIAYLVSHPIQYQAPMLRFLHAQGDLEITALFLSDHSLHRHADPGFGTEIAWDVSLLGGYDHLFLPTVGSADDVSFVRPLVHGIRTALEDGDYDVLWVHGYYHYANWLAVHTANKLGIPVMLRGESTLVGRSDGPLRGFKDRVLRWLFDRVDAFLAIGSWNRHFYRHFGVPDERIFHVPYAVDNAFWQERCAKASAEREQVRSELGLDPDRPVILYASKLTARKRPMDLLEAYVRLSPDRIAEPEPYLLFVGDGEERNRLEARTQQLGWASIRFLGFQNQTELPRYYDLCDVFVLPSAFEPWGLVVNEAMNAGRPVVVSDGVAAGADLVEGGKNGYVVPVGNTTVLSEVLVTILQRDDQGRELGATSRSTIEGWDFRADYKGLVKALDSVTEVSPSLL